MSLSALIVALDAHPNDPFAKLCLIALGDKGDEGGRVRVVDAELALFMGCDLLQVEASLFLLQQGGFISIEDRLDGRWATVTGAVEVSNDYATSPDQAVFRNRGSAIQ